MTSSAGVRAPKIAAIILAAGASRRLGQPKQLVKYQGDTLIHRAARIVAEAGLDPVIVVLGAEADAVRGAVRDERAVFVENDAWPEGMASSMRAGLRALEEVAPHADGALIMPCDQPQLSAEHLSQMVSFFAGNIVASTYAGVRGVPAIFPPETWSALMKLSGDVGARRLLSNPAWPLTEVAFDGGEVDIDVPEDLEQLR